MGMVQIDPEAGKRATLMEGGLYGPGQAEPFEAKVSIAGYTGLVEPGDGPGYDRDCKKDGYSKFEFRVESETYGSVLILDWQTKKANSGSKEAKWLTAAGIAMETDPATGHLSFDDEAVVGVELAGIRVKPARQDKEDPDTYWTGNVIDIVGA